MQTSRVEEEHPGIFGYENCNIFRVSSRALLPSYLHNAEKWVLKLAMQMDFPSEEIFECISANCGKDKIL